MKVYSSTISMEGVALEGFNPLPFFRNNEHNKKVLDDGSLSEKQKEYLGYETGERFLPYQLQDRYNRRRKNMVMQTIILENDVLKAVFLPDFGARLYSLFDKRTGEEILYKNPVMQPANLAILNAWFSGGIEWNIGQLGHTFTTCSPMHAARMTDEDGNEFVRVYEYERCKNLFWSIDFHLPKGADKLFVYVKIVNDNDKTVPMYWWTNIAVRETSETRVFSEAQSVIYLNQDTKEFGSCTLPHLPSAPSVDASYPMKIPFSSEYFFQTESDVKSPWEAAVYEDGKVFFERSTALIRYRKMFCWGNQAGGRHWCDFLAKPGEGDYLELQAGMAPTQLHGLDMPKKTVWDFTQVIGVGTVDANLSHQHCWIDANRYVKECVDKFISSEEVCRLHERLRAYSECEPQQLLHMGSGWGALEKLRRLKNENRQIPQGFRFDDAGLSAAQAPWLELLTHGTMPVSEVPVSWMVQQEWQQLLEMSLDRAGGDNCSALLHYGVMLYENGREDEAIAVWQRALSQKRSSWVLRNLSEAMRRRGELDKALGYYEEACGLLLAEDSADKAFFEEYVDILIRSGKHQRAWELYAKLPQQLAASDRIRMLIGVAACELDKDQYLQQLFESEFAGLREGELLMIDLWYRYSAKKLAADRNVKVTDELLAEARRKCPPPENIDFRMTEK